MMRDPVSVCIPTYNGISYLREQLSSIISELTADDELIIVDDGSTDGTKTTLADLAKLDSRVRVFANSSNVGVIKTVEAALKLATKDIIVLSDQDDIWIQGRIDRALSKLRDHEAVAVLSNSEIFVDGKRTGKLFFVPGRSPRFNVAAQLYKNDFIGCCMCFRRSILETAMPFPENISMHDWWLGVNAIVSGKVIFDDSPAILYRRHESNVSPSTRRAFSKVVWSRVFNALALVRLILRRVQRPMLLR
jgi:glycosyltransferase involved in cell wall biosynthesis